MAEEVPKERLEKEIHDLLKNADIAVLTSKRVRQQMEEKFNCNFFSRKEEIDNIIMAYMNKLNADDDSNSDEEDDDEEEEKPIKRSAAPAGQKRPSNKRSKNVASDESSGSNSDDAYAKKQSAKKASVNKSKKVKSVGSESESESDNDYSPKKPPKGRKSKNTNDSDGSNEEWKKPKVVRKTSGKGKGTGFTRPYTLSPVLAELMGAESLPRHEVVKKVWAIIKERNLYDPKNKQFAICDSDLQKVMGVKRFRTFGMLKYLKQHFIN